MFYECIVVVTDHLAPVSLFFVCVLRDFLFVCLFVSLFVFHLVKISNVCQFLILANEEPMLSTLHFLLRSVHSK